ncbi:MAG TPA: hypothetical protein PK624_06805 [Spirochaetota bacterium]|nr:hypothetical protein [Spirochaetota bacterium]HOR44487.1 hypothetical protein [Spirochaetota bacterium]HOU83799.1 hypothetical protein [Spirochaetota bacterium]HPK56074.1 hypothetical protein [Spirochaetota bacterium]HQE58764.1 hypothetical protein [Spirochaetota bacterium]
MLRFSEHEAAAEPFSQQKIHPVLSNVPSLFGHDIPEFMGSFKMLP